MSKYSDIIEYNYEMKHPRMTIRNRSAQFAPFSALTGYSELIMEKGRETTKKIELSYDDKEMLDYKLQILSDRIKEKKEITITYFIKDLKKTGGKYEIITDIIRKIDFVNQTITLMNKLVINFNDIFDISCDDINFDDIIF